MRTLIFVLTGLMTLLIFPVAYSADSSDGILSIETIGTSRINEEDPSSAEQAAISNALELALDRGVAAIVPPEILAGNFSEIVNSFYGRTEHFILNYKKLAVTKVDGFCRVLVRASIPADNIKGRIRQSGIMIDRSVSPRVLIMISEERDGKVPVYWWRKGGSKLMVVAEKSMAQDFVKRGLTPLSHDRGQLMMDLNDDSLRLKDSAVFEIGRQLGADFVITGRSSVVIPDNFRPERGGDVLGVIDARLLDINTESIISIATIHHSASHSENAPGRHNALSGAGTEAVRRFAPAIITAFEQQKNRPHEYQIRIEGAGYLAYLNTFRNLLASLDGVDQLQINEMKRDEAVISVNFRGSTRELAGKLASAASEGLTINVRRVLEDGIVITLAPPDMTADFNETGETTRP